MLVFELMFTTFSCLKRELTFLHISGAIKTLIAEEVKEPFDKNHLKSQIEAGGGKILDNFDIEKV